LIRKGLLTRDEALHKLSLQVEPSAIDDTLLQLGVSKCEIDALGTRSAAA
jgi:hypothetical protein